MKDTAEIFVRKFSASKGRGCALTCSLSNLYVISECSQECSLLSLFIDKRPWPGPISKSYFFLCSKFSTSESANLCT